MQLGNWVIRRAIPSGQWQYDSAHAAGDDRWVHTIDDAHVWQVKEYADTYLAQTREGELTVVSDARIAARQAKVKALEAARTAPPAVPSAADDDEEVDLSSLTWEQMAIPVEAPAPKAARDPYAGLYLQAPIETPTQPVARKASNPKDACATCRPSVSLIPPSAIAALSLALTEGDCKYRGYNWRVDGARASVYYDALMRHMMRWLDGEDEDPETHVGHLASALASLAILIDAKSLGLLTDDRPPTGRAREVLAETERKVRHLQGLFPGGKGRHTATGGGLNATSGKA